LQKTQGWGTRATCVTEPLNQSANSQNQLTGISYDIAGNVLNDGNGNTPTYDAENRIATDAGVTYSYDADGVRMEKYAPSGTVYWRGPSGTLAETNISGIINEEYIYFNGTRIARVDRPSGTVHYYFSNHLGSHTMVVSATGSCEQDIDYYPYGGIVTDHCPNVAQHYKFTGKERDTESGLDNFRARYNASSMGRFMSPDPEEVSGFDNTDDPQAWNGYAYTRNNPLEYTDPDGEDYRVCDTKGHCTNFTDDQWKLYLRWLQSLPDAANYNVSPSGQITYTNDNGSQTTLGTETWFNGKAVDQTNNSIGMVNAFALSEVTQSVFGFAGARFAGFLEGRLAARAAARAAANTDVDNLTNKIIRDMVRRGFTKQEILDTIQNADAYAVTNKETGGPATEYVSKATGKFVVVDDATGRVLQVGSSNMSQNHWVK
jgi:RHS repeat-associated protein